jgi:cold shock protein
MRVRGRVKYWSDAKGYGFIAIDGCENVFVHHLNIEGEGFKTLDEGQVVSFELVDGPKVLSAKSVRKEAVNAAL